MCMYMYVYICVSMFIYIEIFVYTFTSELFMDIVQKKRTNAKGQKCKPETEEN